MTDLKSTALPGLHYYRGLPYRRGTLSSDLADDPETMRWIREVAEQLPIDAYKHKVTGVSETETINKP